MSEKRTRADKAKRRRPTVHRRIREKNHARTSAKPLCGSSKSLLRSIKPRPASVPHVISSLMKAGALKGLSIGYDTLDHGQPLWVLWSKRRVLQMPYWGVPCRIGQLLPPFSTHSSMRPKAKQHLKTASEIPLRPSVRSLIPFKNRPSLTARSRSPRPRGF
jgi:hypothetical protein